VTSSRLWQLAGLALVAVALAFGLHEVGNGIRARDARDVVTVTGSAKRSISSDYVIWDASVAAQDSSPAAAAAKLAKWTGTIREFLSNEGVHADELAVAPITTDTLTQTNNNGSSGQVTGYNLTRSFEVRSSRIDEIQRAIEASSQLVGNGIPFTAQPPQFIYTKLPDLRPALSAEATKDAINRAKTVVGIAGQHLGKLRSIDVGPFQVTAPGSTQTGDYGSYDTSTRQKDVTSVVNVTFSVG
jgi:uncharacterized protein